MNYLLTFFLEKQLKPYKKPKYFLKNFLKLDYKKENLRILIEKFKIPIKI